MSDQTANPETAPVAQAYPWPQLTPEQLKQMEKEHKQMLKGLDKSRSPDHSKIKSHISGLKSNRYKNDVGTKAHLQEVGTHLEELMLLVGDHYKEGFDLCAKMALIDLHSRLNTEVHGIDAELEVVHESVKTWVNHVSDLGSNFEKVVLKGLKIGVKELRAEAEKEKSLLGKLANKATKVALAPVDIALKAVPKTDWGLFESLEIKR